LLPSLRLAESAGVEARAAAAGRDVIGEPVNAFAPGVADQGRSARRESVSPTAPATSYKSPRRGSPSTECRRRPDKADCPPTAIRSRS
jgi:hypothetical protein